MTMPATTKMTISACVQIQKGDMNRQAIEGGPASP